MSLNICNKEANKQMLRLSNYEAYPHPSLIQNNNCVFRGNINKLLITNKTNKQTNKQMQQLSHATHPFNPKLSAVLLRYDYLRFVLLRYDRNKLSITATGTPNWIEELEDDFEDMEEDIETYRCTCK